MCRFVKYNKKKLFGFTIFIQNNLIITRVDELLYV